MSAHWPHRDGCSTTSSTSTGTFVESALPVDGTLRELLDYFTPWLQDSYDHTRPLWMYVVVDGLADGRSALLSKIHHTVGDGETLVKMSLAYTTTERDAARSG